MNKELITIVSFTLGVFFCFLLVGWYGADQAKDYLKNYEEIDKKNLKISEEMIAAHSDSLNRTKLHQLLVLNKHLSEEQFLSIEDNYPRLTALTLVGLVSAIVAGFLNLIAINRGWSNINLGLKTSLIVTVFVFAISNYSITVFDIQEKIDVSNENFTVLKKIRKDICQFAQTGGVNFYGEEDLPAKNFFPFVHTVLYNVGEVIHGHDSRNLPNPTSMHRDMSEHIGFDKEGASN